ncbi:MAG: diaminopimelate dehydrogenase [Epulopiscium sp.]|uniref:Meso-diaminopimelate D-dehydrogenase n=1 Tax=Defluviitalea raffinosedens TaxID=1450156 RepID=A0A7C8LJA1_9FIRM|nr:diaminopimelate dehydrogenase [Defluviitalea raffinosedens]KAE9636862.1 diaminopimelate dehydrogenase [Defluviitalea raffinosedens]MBZ4668872.1 diaminopimelate dehydrogenase [Defluviitaleaceae bacterium]MDK2789336.1 diaminopimelate dehydrogenase [Candidatus Epulonipiscium sp.]HHW67169.1 diaminopimelate dehydrogenase [Candidatus Epulonipiscium sp.]
MSDKIRVGIVGYGNLGRGVESALKQNPDMELKAIFTRRNPKDIVLKDANIQALHINDIEKYKDEIDVMILCGGSATDLPEQSPAIARWFNIVDSFDTHAKIPEHFAAVDQAAKEGSKVGAISVGWDPGLFSMNRVLAEAVLPEGKHYTFWGRGVSQGHSDAIRRIKGVKNAVQYTIPIEEAIEKVRSGSNPDLTVREKHIRECYVVAEENADKKAIENEIKSMPNYFADYDTIVHFVSEEELKQNHSAMPHGGFVIRSGKTGDGNINHIIEFSLKLDSNPEFTGSVLVAYARAVYRLNKEGQSGAMTVFDIPLAYLSPKSGEELRKELL